MNQNSGCCNLGANLIGLSSSIALFLSENLSSDELAVLGAFFTTLGDNLSLMVASCPEQDNTKNKL